MLFDKEYLSNKIFLEQGLCYDEYILGFLDGLKEQTGLSYRENGDVALRVHAEGCDRVECLINKERFSLRKDENGYFSGVIPYAPHRNGPLNTDLLFDGERLVYPYLPAAFSANALHNFIEFPCREQDFAMLRDVPHGAVTRQVFYSHIRDSFERCLVYTPPGYMSGDERYPVLYLQHGAGENETVWESTGRIANILDNLIAEGCCVPFIVVMNNNMLRYPGNEDGPFDHGFEKLLIDECIPFIEANYRVKPGKWNRAIAGLSMGAYLSNDIALFHPDCFGYYGAFTGCMHQPKKMAHYERPCQDLERTGQIIKENYRVFFQSATPQEDHIDYCEIDHELCRQCGITELPGYRFFIHSPETCKWSSWRMGLRDYAKLLFRAEEIYSGSESLTRCCGI